MWLPQMVVIVLVAAVDVVCMAVVNVDVSTYVVVCAVV